jgi:hypothetical protein
MPGIVDAINAFLELVNKSGVPQKIKEAFDKKREDEAKLHQNVQEMKDAPAPTKPGGPNGR